MTRKRGSEVLSRLVDTKTARLPYARLGHVEGRNTDGTTRLTFLGGTCEARLGITAGRKGEVTLAEPTGLRSRGTAGVPTASLGASRAALWVERLEPPLLCRGEEQVVTIIGHGFTLTTQFEFLMPESLEAHPGIAIVETAWIDESHVELTVSVDVDAPEFEDDVYAPLAFQ